MKNSILVLLVMFVIASAGYCQSTNSTAMDMNASDITTAITNKEKAIYNAIQNGDPNAIEQHLAPEFRSVYSSGVWTRDQEMESIADLMIDSYELSDVKVSQPTEDAALITYTLDSDGSYKDESFSNKYYAASIWVMKDGQWKAVFHTEMQARSDEDMDMDMDSND